jgi:hypothetical protein
MKNKLGKIIKNYTLNFQNIFFPKSNQDTFKIAQFLILSYILEEFRNYFKYVKEDLALNLDQLDKIVSEVNIN